MTQWVKRVTSVRSRRSGMSAMPPIPTELMRHNKTSRGAMTGLMHCSKEHRHSIVSSARSRSEVGIVMPSALAVLRLITNSNLVGCITGRSAGLSPLRILPT
jgi:hypothetical protein